MRRKDLKEAKKVLSEVKSNPCTEHGIKIKNIETALTLYNKRIIIVNRVSFLALLFSVLSLFLHYFI